MKRPTTYAPFILLVLFTVATGAYLHRVPGLMGDEGSEGENVYQLQHAEGITVIGERSYIGPLIDYLRVPFVAAFGYTAFALRALIFLFSVATFVLALATLPKHFGKWPGLFAAVGLGFSPVFILYQRLGWAISLFPFFALLVIWLMHSKLRYKWLFAGLAAGVGLANHIVFLPTMAAVAVGITLYGLMGLPVVQEKRRYVIDTAQGLLAAAVGFWAGFGAQFIVLSLFPEDQGDPSETTLLFAHRLAAFTDAYPLYISGSSFFARYIGDEFSPVIMQLLSYLVLASALAAVVLLYKRRALWAWVGGLAVHVFVLLYVIDRFTLRYFVIVALALWMLAGAGWGAVLEKILGDRPRVLEAAAVAVSVVLMAWVALGVLVPFLRTGGSVADFSLGDRKNSAADFVDTPPLVACLQNAGPVFSENIHIWNRLQYASHQFDNLEILPEEQMTQARWLVHYRRVDAPGGTAPGVRCPELAHFRVVPASE